jgi:L-asparagine transporter-like permease
MVGFITNILASGLFIVSYNYDKGIRLFEYFTKCNYHDLIQKPDNINYPINLKKIKKCVKYEFIYILTIIIFITIILLYYAKFEDNDDWSIIIPIASVCCIILSYFLINKKINQFKLDCEELKNNVKDIDDANHKLHRDIYVLNKKK